jgi:uncharacterized protein (DUF1499 family)
MNTLTAKQISSYLIIAIALVIAFFLWNNHVFAGNRPTDLGMINGRLSDCPNTPNCVSSYAPTTDLEHAIAPLRWSGDERSAMANLDRVIRSLPRKSIVKETNNYLYVEFASKLMGFVDDVEFYFDRDTKTIQVRSASRLGESDLGINRQRIEEIRTKLAN